MKYVNKFKRAWPHWTHITVSQNNLELKRWCQANGSSDRFAIHRNPERMHIYANGDVSIGHTYDWYFENAHDATVFKLKFG